MYYNNLPIFTKIHNKIITPVLQCPKSFESPHFQAMRIFRYLTSESNQWNHNNQTTTTTTATGMIFSLSGTHCSWATNQLMSQLRIISLLTGEKNNTHRKWIANSRHKQQLLSPQNSTTPNKTKSQKSKNPAHQEVRSTKFQSKIQPISFLLFDVSWIITRYNQTSGSIPAMDVVPPPLGSSHASHNGHESPEFAEIAKTSDIWKWKKGRKVNTKCVKCVMFEKIDTSCTESIEFLVSFFAKSIFVCDKRWAGFTSWMKLAVMASLGVPNQDGIGLFEDLAITAMMQVACWK